jgi:hypothetical protein
VVRSLARYDHPRGIDADLLRDVVNVENLFDEENAVVLGDKVFRAIKNDIAGWTHWSPRSVHLEDALVEIAERSTTTARYLADSN